MNLWRTKDFEKGVTAGRITAKNELLFALRDLEGIVDKEALDIFKKMVKAIESEFESERKEDK